MRPRSSEVMIVVLFAQCNQKSSEPREGRIERISLTLI
jgi:hypothetical protein